MFLIFIKLKTGGASNYWEVIHQACWLCDPVNGLIHLSAKHKDQHHSFYMFP